MKAHSIPLLCLSLTMATHAAIVNLDLTGYTSANAGIPYDGNHIHYSISVSLDPDDEFAFYNDSDYIGIDTNGGASIAVSSLSMDASTSPQIFTANQTIDSSWAYFSDAQWRSAFRDTGNGTEVASLPSGSYMAFKTGDGQYGWLEVDYNATTNTFHLLRGAIETTPGQAILAGATSYTLVPEPSSFLLLTLPSLFLLRRRRN